MSECLITCCRGCCCGKEDPIEAELLLERLRDALPGVVVRTSDCLGPCERKDVIVVTPSSKQRKRGARSCWIGWASTDGPIDEIADWVRNGGPGEASMPARLGIHSFRPNRRKGKRAG